MTMAQADFNLLISAAGRRVSLLESFRASLEELSVPGVVWAGDTSRHSAAAQRADRRTLVPPATSGEFIPFMTEVVRANDIKLIIPTIDTELQAYATHREAFAALGCTVAISGAESVEIASDKRLTHRWLRAHGFPTIQQCTSDAALADASTLRFPLIVKPARGSASAGVARIDTPDALQRWGGAPDFVVEEMAPGVEFTVDAYVTMDGRCLEVVPRQRLETRAGEVSKGVTRRVAQIEQTVRSIVERLPAAFGCITVQLFFDAATGRIAVIEINPRFGGGFPLSWAAGARFPAMLISECLGRPYASPSWRADLVMLRYDDAVFVDEHDL
jgi:carbamoyl-phosphate synthase large subunit